MDPMQSLEDIKNMLCRGIKSTRQASSDFDLNPEFSPPEAPILKPAAVLIAVTQDMRVILTKRSTQLKHHPGQIAFPGGRKDDTDHDLVQTALREAKEEIGLDPASVRTLGNLPKHETVTNYAVTPIVGMVPSGLTFVAEPDEVSEVFTVPLSHVLDLSNYRIEGRRWRGQRRHYYTMPYGPYYIWGATARILHGLAEGMA